MDGAGSDPEEPRFLLWLIVANLTLGVPPNSLNLRVFSVLDDYYCLEFLLFGFLVPFLALHSRCDSGGDRPVPRQTEPRSPSHS